MGAIFRIGDGHNCKFWHDCWLQNVPLCISHDALFKMVRDPNCSVADCLDDGQWVIEVRRTVSANEYNIWLDLLDELHSVNFFL